MWSIINHILLQNYLDITMSHGVQYRTKDNRGAYFHGYRNVYKKEL
ncbi:hypothetical protein MtrunA17_Chr4g0071821 [Medicago truncatula]|nr:hypothetical protein MtrunA17_Chr4g0071821 [Medicago truncatula]